MIKLAMQNIVDAHSRHVTGVEVLARWCGSCQAARTPLLPESFMSKEDAWEWWTVDLVVMELVEKVNRIRIPEVPVHTNLAPETMQNTAAWKLWLDHLDRATHSHAPGIVVEISEKLFTDSPQLDEHIQEMRRFYNVKVAIDDVGVGNSTHERLYDHNWDMAKIDWRPKYREGINGHLGQLLDFCRQNKITSVLEGVENENDIRIARQYFPDMAQGYAYGHPVIVY